MTGTQRSTGSDADAEILRLLTKELPDPNQELSQQNLKPALNSFTLFPKLLIETRLQIWRYTFPSRRALDLSGTEAWRQNVKGYPTQGPWLISLMVDHESRTETLRHYKILFPYNGPSCYYPRVIRPIFINLERDTVSFNILNPIGIILDIYDLCPEWFGEIKLSSLGTISGMVLESADPSPHNMHLKFFQDA